METKQTLNEWVGELQTHYHLYRHSLPSKNEGGQDDSLVFKALPYGHLTVADVSFGVNREIARENLDAHFLKGIIDGIIWPWPAEWEKTADGKTAYNWQSKIEPTLVIFKDVVRYYAEKHNH